MNTTDVPDGLQDRLYATVKTAAISEALSGERTRKSFRAWAFPISLAGAMALIAVLLLLRPSGPKDTFRQPEEAYAQIEETLSLILDQTSTMMTEVSNGNNKK